MRQCLAPALQWTHAASHGALVSDEWRESLRLFAANVHKVFCGFEPDFFQHNLLLVVDDFVSVIKRLIELPLGPVTARILAPA